MAEENKPFRSVVPEDDLPPAREVDTSVPHIARIYNCWLGGKDNFAVDREAAERVTQATPAILPGVRANRAFLGRAVRYLVAEIGIRQFLDIGTGFPAPTTPTRWPRPPPRTAGSSTSTTTRSCWPTPAPC